MTRSLLFAGCAGFVLVALTSGCTTEDPVADAGHGSGADAGRDAGALDGGLAISVTQWCATSALDARCDFSTRCGAYQTRAGCLEVAQQQLELYGVTTCGAALAGLHDSRQSYDEVASATSLAAVATTTCAAGMPPSCRSAFQGRVAINGYCYDSTDCAAGGYCESSPTTCPGTCRPRADAGAVVTNPRACGEGLQYRIESLTAYRCIAPASLGQPCLGDNPYTCQAPLRCNPATNLCAPAKTAGQPCGLFDAGYFAQVVNDCESPLQCQPGDGGVAVCAPYGRLGDACGTCAFDLRCAHGDGGQFGTCAVKGVTNDECTQDNDCARGFSCWYPNRPFVGVCVAPREVGGGCSSNRNCRAGLSCQLGASPDGGPLSTTTCAAGDAGPAATGCVDPTP
jgi:hypothetical protein